jgi:hypothetical protein
LSPTHRGGTMATPSWRISVCPRGRCTPSSCDSPMRGGWRRVGNLANARDDPRATSIA